MTTPSPQDGAPEGRRRSSVRTIIVTVVVSVGIALLTLVLLEGGASVYLFVHDYRAATAPNTIVRPHTMGDTLLGWVNRKSFSSPSEYGEGLPLFTNARGFRGTRDLDSAAAPGEVRVVCSGDSFTLASGTGEGHQWCSLLEGMFPGLRTANMGQGAYGIDQAYLWYKRDAAHFQHNIEVLAITGVQLERATTNNFAGRSKPLLRVANGRLVVTDVPVPAQTQEQLRRAYASRVLDELKVMQLIRKVPRFSGERKVRWAVEAQWGVMEKMLDDLRATNQARGSELVLAYLPVYVEARENYRDAWRRSVEKYARKNGVRFFDLTPALRQMRHDSLDLAFISRVPPGSPSGVPGHYTNLGNLWAARILADSLATMPQFQHLHSNSPTPKAGGDSK